MSQTYTPKFKKKIVRLLLRRLIAKGDGLTGADAFIGLCSFIRTLNFYHLIRNHECTLPLDKNNRLYLGHYYRLYFRQANPPDPAYGNNPWTDLLGYEEVTEIPEKV